MDTGNRFSIDIEEVADYLGLERKPNQVSGDSFNVRCPLCGDRGYHMNINRVKNVYHCVRCMDSTCKNTGILDLYGRAALGTPVNGVNNREIYKSLLKALGQNSNSFNPTVRYPSGNHKPGGYHDIRPASDKQLDIVYSALLSLPYLRLTPSHRDKLLNRGLSEEDITVNGYASMCDAEATLKFIEDTLENETSKNKIGKIREFYAQNGLSQMRKENKILAAYSDEEIILGMKIAADVIAAAHTYPSNVPGFYKICGKWAFRSVNCGILIPTRNPLGKIVGIQTRLDASDKLKYMTVSSKGLDGGVTTAIARTHFPLRQRITKDTIIILTEGPLKSDTALSLLRKHGVNDAAFIALQGVTSNRELPNIARALQKLGVKEVYDGFDIDKLVNRQVFTAFKSAQRIFRESGDIKLKPLLWDREYAELKADCMLELCKSNGLEFIPTGNVFIDIVNLSAVLDSAGVNYHYIEIDGEIRHEKWQSKTKGIDNYLKNLQETNIADGKRY